MSTRILVRSYLAARGLTVNQLAQMVAGKVGRSQVFDFLSGAHDITTEKADAILAALSVPLAPPAPESPAWVVSNGREYWSAARKAFGAFAKATRFPSWDEAVEAAQEDAALPPEGAWAVVPVEHHANPQAR